MIPADFEYVAPASLEEALGALAQDEDAKLLAGGHSLIPLMKLRLAAPTLLVDLRTVPGLDGIRRDNGNLVVGAMVRHHALATHEGAGLAGKAASTIADQQVRNRGTVGGSLVHGDPASDLPAVLLATEGAVKVAGAGGQERVVGAADFFEDYLTTAVQPGEIATEVHIPAMDGWSFGYQKFNRRQEDWAMVAVCALVKRSPDGACEDVRIGLTHMGSTPLRAVSAEAALRGSALDPATIRMAADQADDGTEPPADLNASAEYKRHLARVLCRRAIEEAVAAG